LTGFSRQMSVHISVNTSAECAFPSRKDRKQLIYNIRVYDCGQFVVCSDLVLFYPYKCVVIMLKCLRNVGFFLSVWCNSPTQARTAYASGFWITHNATPQLVGLLCTRDRPDTETCTSHHPITHKKQTSMPRRDWNPQSLRARGHSPSP
jgi:hypothetical protein